MLSYVLRNHGLWICPNDNYEYGSQSYIVVDYANKALEKAKIKDGCTKYIYNKEGVISIIVWGPLLV